MKISNLSFKTCILGRQLFNHELLLSRAFPEPLLVANSCLIYSREDCFENSVPSKFLKELTVKLLFPLTRFRRAKELYYGCDVISICQVDLRYPRQVLHSRWFQRPCRQRPDIVGRCVGKSRLLQLQWQRTYPARNLRRPWSSHHKHSLPSSYP